MTATLPPSMTPSEADDVHVVADCPEPLRAFNLAGVLHPADVHTATTLCRLAGCDDEGVLLATALAVRGPRVGHVCVDLASVHETVTDREDDTEAIRALPWPTEIDAWLTAVRAATTLVALGGADDGASTGDDDAADGTARPLTLDGSRLYLDRYWRYEQLVATQLRRRARRAAEADTEVLRRGLDELFGAARPGRPDLQRLAAATAVTRSLTVIAGGPGTGKTTTVARVLALLEQQHTAAGEPPPRVALAAPTGKAAARLEESLREALGRDGFDPAVRERLATAEASTIHRLLRRHPGSSSRFRHHAGEPLPHDVVVVDEASMVSLSLMAKLLDALPTHARLVLVGDPQQLRSVEAGAVLGEIVGPALQGLQLSTPARTAVAAATGEDLTGLGETAPEPGIGDGIVVLQRVHRFREGSGIAELATAVQAGDAPGVLEVLRSGRDDVTWIERDSDAADDTGTELAGVRDEVIAVGARIREAAGDGQAGPALLALEELRVLCAHRRGPFGVATWVARVEAWLGQAGAGDGPGGFWQAGRPVLVTRNDHQLRVYNGDIGVVVATDEGPRVAFPAVGEPRLLPPSRLEAVETVHAMTIHKSQGSQFAHTIVVLPTDDSLVLSRELFYTGITRAQRRVTIVGSEATVRAGVERQVRRASGLRERLWPDGVAPPAAG